MKVKLDENLPRSLVGILLSAGHFCSLGVVAGCAARTPLTLSTCNFIAVTAKSTIA